MGSSGLKNLWKALKPPPAVPRRPQPEDPGKVSLLRRMWDAVKPPPAVYDASRALTPEQRRRRRWMIAIPVIVVVIGSGGWSLYLHISSAPQRATAMLQEGMRVAATGDDAAAVKLYTQAVETWPSLTNAYYQRGLARQILNEQDLALADFEKVVNANPNMGPAHTALGSLFRQRGDIQRALNEFGLAIQLTGDVDAYYQRGQVYESLGEHQKAIADYDSAISQIRDAPYVYAARALARENLGDKDGAEEDRQTSVELQVHIRSSRVPAGGSGR
jgi:tetratricopeptide (TPR) repeat protein